MASALTRKRKRSISTARPRRVADLTTDELQGIIDQRIERKLAEYGASPMHLDKAVTGQMRKRAAAAAGRFHSGRSDVSATHDDHLTTSYLG